MRDDLAVGKRGQGYGSEDNLRRYLEEAQQRLNRDVASSVGARPRNVSWLDFGLTRRISKSVADSFAFASRAFGKLAGSPVEL